MTRFTAMSACLALTASILAAPPLAGREPEVGDEMAAFEMEWVRRSPKEAASRAHAMAEVMLGQRLSYEELEKTLGSRELRSTSWVSAFPEATQLKLRWVGDYDEIRLLDIELISDIDGGELDEKEAVEIAAKYMKELHGRKVVDIGHFDLESAQVGYHQVAAGEKGAEKAYERTTEFRVTFRRVINGIEMANSGVRLAVHSSGRLAGIRLGGVTVSSRSDGGREVPTGKGRMLERKVARDEIEEKFKETVSQEARTDVAWSKVMYVMPEDEGQALVEPLQVYSYTEIYEVEKQAVPSRRKIVGFSLTDPRAPAIDFTAPARKHEEEKIRQPPR